MHIILLQQKDLIKNIDYENADMRENNQPVTNKLLLPIQTADIEENKSSILHGMSYKNESKQMYSDSYLRSVRPFNFQKKNFKNTLIISHSSLPLSRQRLIRGNQREEMHTYSLLRRRSQS